MDISFAGAWLTCERIKGTDTKEEGLAILAGGPLPRGKADCNDVEASFLLSAACGNLGKFEEVLQICQQIVALQSGFGAAHTNMGNVLTALGKHDEPASHYEQALRLNPDHPVT